VDPCILALDTATRMASIALYDGERVHSEETWHSERNHTVELMPSLVRLLERQRVSPQELTGVVVALGPGSFTGLRIGLSVAKGLALALSGFALPSTGGRADSGDAPRTIASPPWPTCASRSRGLPSSVVRSRRRAPGSCGRTSASGP